MVEDGEFGDFEESLFEDFKNEDNLSIPTLFEDLLSLGLVLGELLSEDWDEEDTSIEFCNPNVVFLLAPSCFIILGVGEDTSAPAEFEDEDEEFKLKEFGFEGGIEFFSAPAEFEEDFVCNLSIEDILVSAPAEFDEDIGEEEPVEEFEYSPPAELDEGLAKDSGFEDNINTTAPAGFLWVVEEYFAPAEFEDLLVSAPAEFDEDILQENPGIEDFAPTEFEDLWFSAPAEFDEDFKEDNSGPEDPYVSASAEFDEDIEEGIPEDFSATAEFEDILLSSTAEFKEAIEEDASLLDPALHDEDEDNEEDINHHLINSAPTMFRGVHKAPTIMEGVIISDLAEDFGEDINDDSGPTVTEDFDISFEDVIRDGVDTSASIWYEQGNKDNSAPAEFECSGISVTIDNDFSVDVSSVLSFVITLTYCSIAISMSASRISSGMSTSILGNWSSGSFLSNKPV